MFKNALILFLLFVPMICEASNQNTISRVDGRLPVVLLAGQSELTTGFVDALSAALSAPVDVIDLNKLAPTASNKAIYITVGADALSQYLALNYSEPVIAVYVTRAGFYHTIQAHKHLAAAKGEVAQYNHVGAVFSDPDPATQFLLMKKLFPNIKKAGLLMSPLLEFQKAELITAANSAGISLRIKNHTPGENLNASLNEVGDSEAILALADQQIWTPTTVKNLIISTYRQQKPVVGFSRSLVAAGAIATSFSTVEDIAGQVKTMIGSSRLAAVYPVSFKHEYNQSVLTSFGMKMPLTDSGR